MQVYTVYQTYMRHTHWHQTLSIPSSRKNSRTNRHTVWSQRHTEQITLTCL